MKNKLMVLLMLTVSVNVIAATQTIETNAVIDLAKYTRSVTFSGKYFSYNVGKKGLNLRMTETNFTPEARKLFAIAFEGKELLDVIAKHPLVFGDRIVARAKCNGRENLIIRLIGSDHILYGSTCRLVSLTVTTPDSVVDVAPVLEQLPPVSLPELAQPPIVQLPPASLPEPVQLPIVATAEAAEPVINPNTSQLQLRAIENRKAFWSRYIYN